MRHAPNSLPFEIELIFDKHFSNLPYGKLRNEEVVTNDLKTEFIRLCRMLRISHSVLPSLIAISNQTRTMYLNFTDSKKKLSDHQKNYKNSLKLRSVDLNRIKQINLLFYKNPKDFSQAPALPINDIVLIEMITETIEKYKATHHNTLLKAKPDGADQTFSKLTTILCLTIFKYLCVPKVALANGSNMPATFLTKCKLIGGILHHSGWDIMENQHLNKIRRFHVGRKKMEELTSAKFRNLGTKVSKRILRLSPKLLNNLRHFLPTKRVKKRQSVGLK